VTLLSGRGMAASHRLTVQKNGGQGNEAVSSHFMKSGRSTMTKAALGFSEMDIAKDGEQRLEFEYPLTSSNPNP
jgi:hypothetical protein